MIWKVGTWRTGLWKLGTWLFGAKVTEVPHQVYTLSAVDPFVTVSGGYSYSSVGNCPPLTVKRGPGHVTLSPRLNLEINPEGSVYGRSSVPNYSVPPSLNTISAEGADTVVETNRPDPWVTGPTNHEYRVRTT